MILTVGIDNLSLHLLAYATPLGVALVCPSNRIIIEADMTGSARGDQRSHSHIGMFIVSLVRVSAVRPPCAVAVSCALYNVTQERGHVHFDVELEEIYKLMELHITAYTSAQ